MTTPTTTTTALTPTIERSSTNGIKVDASIIAKPFRDEIKYKVHALQRRGIDPPLLVGILANRDPAARRYADWTARAARADGLRYELRQIDEAQDVEGALVEANDDPHVHGIIVYYPIFGSEQSFSGTSQDDYLRDSVSYKCDVEGLCHLYRTNLYRNVRFLDYPSNEKKCLLPCTALSVVKILEHVDGCYDSQKPVGRRMEGNVVTIVNRSEIVGRPLAAMLANDGATVYSIDIESIYLLGDGRRRLVNMSERETTESCIRKSTIVITGVPSKTYRLDTTWIQPDTTVVNVSSYKNVDEHTLLQIPGVVYVPMVGKVTVAMLERNLFRLYDNFHSPRLVPPPEKEASAKKTGEGGATTTPWYGNVLQLYTAVAVTALVAIQIMKRR